MDIYLPITGMSINILYLIALGGGVGFLSGMLGVSGGFLLTPILIVLGIPAPVAVASQSAGAIAISTTGVVGHWRRNNVDFKMGIFTISGGIAGSLFGVFVFTVLNTLGFLEMTIKIAYVLLLGTIGMLMMWELAWLKNKHKHGVRRGKFHEHYWFHGLPFRMRFKKSRLYISVIPALIIGFIIAFLAALTGIGGGLLMVPAMIYLLGMHTSVVVGTSLLQNMFVAIIITILQATINQNVDIFLSTILFIGGTFGTVFGVKITSKLQGEQLRLLLAIIMLAVAGNLLIDVLFSPSHIYNTLRL